LLDPSSGLPAFALRSRLKTLAKSDLPLAGLRVVVKDNIDMKGMKTGVGNQAFYDTYPERSESAECVQKLVELGVSIVGKAKMTSFANWEEPIEYVDYQAPWNPRGDRYQSPGGSSSGSAAAVAAYNWLDAAVGTDSMLPLASVLFILKADQY
jgi:Asp-tRNA(Asn)/Glu-tRNA(Gln) amidotransferase A subunit family amidase